MSRPRIYPEDRPPKVRVAAGRQDLKAKGGARKEFRLSPDAHAALKDLMSRPGAPKTENRLVEDILLGVLKPAPPQVVEKIIEVERVVEVEKIIRVPAKPSKASKVMADVTWSTDREKAVITRFGQKDPDIVKRFQVNTKKAATAVYELMYELDKLRLDEREPLASDLGIMKQAAEMLQSYQQILHRAKDTAAFNKDAAKRQSDKRHRDLIASTALQLFGPEPAPETILSMAQDMLEFTKVARSLLATKGAERGGFGIDEHKIDASMKSGDIPKIANTITEARLDVGLQSSRSDQYWFAGWQDFEDWRAEKIT